MTQRRRWWIIYLTVSLLAATLPAVIVYCSRTVPRSQASAVFQRYADTPGVEAAYIRDMRYHDTISVDLTLFRAQDSLTFVQMLREFYRTENNVNFIMTSAAANRPGGRVTAEAPKHDLKQLPDTVHVLNNYIMVTFPKDRVVAFFEVYDEVAFDIILLDNAHEKNTIPLKYNL